MNAEVVRAFADGWKAPHPHAWDELLAPNVVLEQPLLQSGTGIELWHRGLSQVLKLMPDLSARVVQWAGSGETLFLEVELAGTLGGKPYAYRAVDRLRIDGEGRIVERTTFLDPGPLALAIAARPRAWGHWWRSGLPPLTARHRLSAPSASARGRTVHTLGSIRVLVGVTTLVAPRVARWSLGIEGGADGTLARLFGVRDGVLGLATLSKEPTVREVGLRLGALSDLSDVAAVLLGRRAGVGRRGTVLVGGAAAVFAAAGGLAVAARSDAA